MFQKIPAWRSSTEKQINNKQTPPLTQKLLDIDTHQERENDFLQSSHSGYIDCSPGQSHA